MCAIYVSIYYNNNDNNTNNKSYYVGKGSRSVWGDNNKHPKCWPASILFADPAKKIEGKIF